MSVTHLSAVARPAPDVAGLKETEQLLQAAKGRLATMKARLADAEGELATATDDRIALVNRASGGEKVSAKESLGAADAIRAAEANVHIMRDALPAAVEAVKSAEDAISSVLRLEAVRLHELAAAHHRAAEARVEAAQLATRDAADLAAECQRIVTVAGNAEGWSGRVPHHEAIRDAIADLADRVVGIGTPAG